MQKAQEAYIERELFVIGDQDTGKSTQLRSMFLDWHLGTQGEVPTENNPRKTYALSKENQDCRKMSHCHLRPAQGCRTFTTR